MQTLQGGSLRFWCAIEFPLPRSSPRSSSDRVRMVPRCDICGDEDATVHCDGCRYNFCALCSTALHEDERRRDHVPAPIFVGLRSCPEEQRERGSGAASAELAAGGGGTGRRRGLGEADATGGAERKKPRSLCPHQRQRSQCKECGGGSICPHQRRRRQCKECGGASICQHQRRRSECKECGGASICQHQRIRSECKECGGASLCQHQRQRIQCKECGGAGVKGCLLLT